MFQHLYLLGRSATFRDTTAPLIVSAGFQHLYLLGRSATSVGEVGWASVQAWFQHLYLLGRSATSGKSTALARSEWFQHLYLLGRSATERLGRSTRQVSCIVSTPLPSGKVCDANVRYRRKSCQRCFNTFTFWEGLRPLLMSLLDMLLETFQHHYLLGRSATT